MMEDLGAEFVKIIMMMGINLFYSMICVIFYIVSLKVVDKLKINTSYSNAVAIGIAIVIGFACT